MRICKWVTGAPLVCLKIQRPPGDRLYGSIEGFHTADLKDAKALLDDPA